MPNYPEEHRKALGEYVRRMRSERGFAELSDWMEATGRSDRYLLGLERGEPAGPKTIKVVASALGIEEGVLFGILNSGYVPTVTTWGVPGPLEEHAADPFGTIDLNLMFSQAVRFAATIGILVPEVREEAEKVSLALSNLFARGYELWDRGDPLDKYDTDEVVINLNSQSGGDGDADTAGGPAPMKQRELSDLEVDEAAYKPDEKPKKK